MSAMLETINLHAEIHKRKILKGIDLHVKVGQLAAFSGVSGYPARVKCASLSWHTLNSALHSKEAKTSVTTE